MHSRLMTGVVLVGLAATPSSRALQQPEQPVAVCVVAPRVEPVEMADALGVVPVSRPRLVVVEPLLELRIERPRAQTWRLLGSRDQPIATPLDWPTTPIRPDEPVLLQLRPRDASEGAFAHVHLVGASADRMARSQRLIDQLSRGGPDADWLGTIDRALQDGDVALAWALLFAPQIPDDGQLRGLQQEVIQRGCGD